MEIAFFAGAHTHLLQLRCSAFILCILREIPEREMPRHSARLEYVLHVIPGLGSLTGL
jgi:hypothetical protein